MEIEIGMDIERSEEFVNPAQACNTVRKDVCNLCGFTPENRDVIEVAMEREVEIEMDIEDRNRDGDKDRHG